MKAMRMHHVGIVVRDLNAVKAFFLDLGLEEEASADLSGELVDRIVGLKDVKSAIAMLRTSDGHSTIELCKFYSPADEAPIQAPPANTLGIRHLSFVVDDIEAVVANLKRHGAEPFSEIQRYENIFKTCYIRGPEGIIVELGEEIG